MKLSQSTLKLIIKILILMMLFVIMFMISSFLYSARYWPDIYNYINANITIRRIPTLSELQLTVIEVGYTTETYEDNHYSTTDDDYLDASTVNGLDIEEFMKEEINFNKKVKRDIVIEQLKDYIELPPRPIFVDYIFLEEPIKEDINIPKTVAGDDTPPKEIEEDGNIFKTSVTGIVIENDLPKTMVSEEPAVTKKYYTVQPTKSKDSKRCVDQDEATEQDITGITEMTTIEYIPEYSTTKEGYLVGDDPNSKVDEVTEEPTFLTTKANEKRLRVELVDDEQDTRLMRDSVDVSKLSTRGSEDVEMVTGKPWKLQMMPDPPCHGVSSCQEFTKTVFPWIVSIYVTNSSEENQFSYYCDGVLITDKVIVTDARCMIVQNKTLDPDSMLIFLGKVNLQSFGGNETIHKVDSIIIHPNFTAAWEGTVTNDLALIVLDEAVELNENIQSACIHQERIGSEESATTAWSSDGGLVPILFNREKDINCFDKDEDIFCATYGNEVPLCPSYGGIFATRQSDRWCLTGIFFGEPAERGICFKKNVHYTALTKHLKWIDETVGMFKNDVL